jgi:chromate reductase
MANGPKLLFLSGSTRSGSVNVKLAKLAQKTADKNAIETTYLDLAQYPLPIYDGDLEDNEGVPENAHKIRDIFDAHHGVFIASPEYNGGVSPLLKNTIDWLTRIVREGEVPGQMFRTRAFALGAASPSPLGGVRGLIQLRSILGVAIGSHVIGSQAQVADAMNAFDADGNLTDEKAFGTLKSIVAQLAETSSKLYT